MFCELINQSTLLVSLRFNSDWELASPINELDRTD